MIDDHSRVDYTEIYEDEKAVTAIGVLRRSVAWFAARGVTVGRVPSNNGSAPRSHAWRDARHDSRSHRKRRSPTDRREMQRSKKLTAPSPRAAPSPATKIPNQHYATPSPAWLHHYNHHRPNTATGKHPPVTRLTNVPGQYT